MLINKSNTMTNQEGHKKLYVPAIGNDEIAIRLNDMRQNKACVENVKRRLLRLGGKITRESQSGTVYVGFPSGTIVRISDHEILSRDGFTTPKGGADREILVHVYF